MSGMNPHGAPIDGKAFIVHDLGTYWIEWETGRDWDDMEFKTTVTVSHSVPRGGSSGKHFKYSDPAYAFGQALLYITRDAA